APSTSTLTTWSGASSPGWPTWRPGTAICMCQRARWTSSSGTASWSGRRPESRDLFRRPNGFERTVDRQIVGDLQPAGDEERRAEGRHAEGEPTKSGRERGPDASGDIGDTGRARPLAR